MSFASQLGALTHELLQVLLPSSSQSESRKLDKLRDVALRRLKCHTYLQANPFEVEKALDGLDERFRVNNRDDLADALLARLHALKNLAPKSQSLPDILLFLLELSDQPTFKSRLSDLDSLKQTDVEPPPTLRWEDIAKEDGWEEDDLLWRSVDYSDDSDDEAFEQGSAGNSEATSMLDEAQHTMYSAHSHIVHPEDQGSFELVRSAQSWRSAASSDESLRQQPRKVAVPEMQVVRDVLFMLQGLDCTLFERDFTAVPSFQLENMQWDTFRAMMQGFADYGKHLGTLRSFVAERLDVPHLQALQDCIADRLRKLESRISELQAALGAPRGEYVLSVIKIKADLTACLEPFCTLADIVSSIEAEPQPTPFRYLELIFDETCLAQLTGNSQVYEFLGRIFSDCFRVYLRPIRLWMDQGKLLSASDLFFVAETASTTPLHSTWKDGYKLRETADGTLHSPAFLRAAVSNIYNAGKNVVVLKLLGKHDAAIARKQKIEPSLDYEAICAPGQELVPFSELFDIAFDRWIQSKYRETSRTLKECLFQDWSLMSVLDSLHKIYFMSDGSSAAAFAESLFPKLDELGAGWLDRYALTMAAQDSFASIMDPGRLAVRVEAALPPPGPTQARDSVRAALSGIKMDYRLPWPLRMTLTDASLEHYQSLFTFQLQLKRAAHALGRPRILDNYWTDRDNRGAADAFYSARSTLLWFCSTVQTYLTTLVLAPAVAQLRRDMVAANDMDEMICTHDRALKAMVDQACLGRRLAPIRDSILDVLDLALKLERTPSGATDTRSDGATGTRREQRCLRDIKEEAEGQIRFTREGLRSVARATSDAQSAKWDMLADMLQAGYPNE
ncbi:uncharacterized protein UV8b_03120 [Ustilaginoidea virens]|uniref:Spindle pole body component n=1 Tax=Ustilaginoidea virens TaxID=1159556 RepID=A0A8E5HP06_USTVR|nr:uncharacterized protein UV8b_03120 [Ustilaginoidea virens]QUC18879.1 hypothetical protein UV8b_03120 [Ustilaginoidea virens]